MNCTNITKHEQDESCEKSTCALSCMELKRKCFRKSRKEKLITLSISLECNVTYTNDNQSAYNQ